MARAAMAAGPGPAPVHLWDPPYCGELDLRIARDGSWHYQGSPIGRARMVQLFASILKREGDRYVLVTPVEKVGITVEDAPFVAVDFAVTGSGRQQMITFVTSLGERVTAGPDAPIRVTHAPKTGEPAPYVTVRPGLEARIDRKSFYRLVALCEEAPHQGAPWLGLWSGGSFFPVLPSAEADLPAP